MASGFSEEWFREYQARRDGAVLALSGAKAFQKSIAPPPVLLEQNTISLALSAPPGVNAMYSNVPGKGRVRSTVYRKWRKAAMTEALVGMAGKRRIIGPFRATIRLSARGDLDGPLKAGIDICKSVGAIVDDIHLVELHVYRQSGRRGIWIVLEPSSADVRSAASP